jgi:hypothetical protein
MPGEAGNSKLEIRNPKQIRNQKKPKAKANEAVVQK